MIKINNLSFKYGKANIFNNFDLDIHTGEVTLITGINGVGKSTLLRLLAGVLKPAAGEIVFAKDMGADPRRKIGFISDTPSLYENMKVGRAIDFHRLVYRFVSYDDRLVKQTGIDLNKKIRELSRGQRVIFHLSLILSAEPRVLLIDEILHSIDIYLRGLFLKEVIKLLAEKKVTVVFVNLNFRDIENIVDRVILLKDGNIRVDETIDDLKAKVKKIICREPPPGLPVLSVLGYSDHSEFFIYPFREEYRQRSSGEVVDLDLTDIICAFIGGEYA